MNRFEQPKPRIMRKIVYILPLAAFVLLLVFFLKGITSVSETTLDKQQESLETALSRSITQCYAVEGAYPPNLEYLELHYGLTYDKTLFFIDYQVFGSNLMPDVTVLRREESN